MSEVKAFNTDETVNISMAKEALQRLIRGAHVYEFATYNFSHEKYDLSTGLTGTESSSIVIAGGVIASLLLKEAINDIDVFILKKDHMLFQKLVNMKPGTWTVRYFFDDKNDSREEDYKNPHVFAIASNKESKVQYILTDHVDRKSLLHNFDFLHCTASYHDGMLYINRETYDAIMNKRLIPQDKKKPIKSRREQKYVMRGWSTPLDVIHDMSTKTLKEILSDQLHNLRKPVIKPVTKKKLDDGWQQAAATSGWLKGYEDLIADALSKGKATYGDDISLDDLLDDPYAEILKKPK